MKLFGNTRPNEKVQLQEMHEAHDLSQQLYLRRELLGMTQEELGTAAGLTQSQVATVEAGHANPTLRTMTKVAVALGCRVRDLFREDAPVLKTSLDAIDFEALQSHQVVIAQQPTQATTPADWLLLFAQGVIDPTTPVRLIDMEATRHRLFHEIPS